MTTIVIHANHSTVAELKAYEEMIDANRENIVPYSDFFKLEARPQCMTARIREYVLAFEKACRAAWPIKEPARISGWKGVGVQIRKRKRNQKRMKEPIRVLQVLGTTGLGGAESRVMDLYRISTVRGCSLILQCTPQKKGILMKRLKRLADIFTDCRGFRSITGSRIGRRGAVF